MFAPDTEFAPAKVNLHLHVLGRRRDGYHLLDSLVVFAGVGDRLSVSATDRLSLSVTGRFAAGLAGEDDNLVLRAARVLAERAGVRAAASLVLEKNLPVASGIGGGSADAAAALRLLCRFWRLDRGLADRVALGLGADVPACLAGAPALMSGIGEGLAAVTALPDVGIVLVNPGVAVATPVVFRTLEGAFSEAARFPRRGWDDVGGLVDSLLDCRNDLEEPAIRLAPGIGEALRAVGQAPGCMLARMSGSGATCFGLFASAVAARAAAATIGRDGWWSWGGGLMAG